MGAWPTPGRCRDPHGGEGPGRLYCATGPTFSIRRRLQRRLRRARARAGSWVRLPAAGWGDGVEPGDEASEARVDVDVAEPAGNELPAQLLWREQPVRCAIGEVELAGAAGRREVVADATTTRAYD